jgi:hypothetical protein
MAKTDRINRGENTPQDLKEMARTLRALSTAIERAGKKLSAKNQPFVRVLGTVGAWKCVHKLQRYSGQLKLEINNLPPVPPK